MPTLSVTGKYVLAVLLIVLITPGPATPAQPADTGQRFAALHAGDAYCCRGPGHGPSVLAAVAGFSPSTSFSSCPTTLSTWPTRATPDLLIYLAAALIAGRLAAYAQRQAEAAGFNAEQQEILYGLTSALNPLTDPRPSAPSCAHTLGRMGADQVILPASPGAAG